MIVDVAPHLVGTGVPAPYRHIVAVTGSASFERTLRAVHLLAHAAGADVEVLHIEDGECRPDAGMRAYLAARACDPAERERMHWADGDVMHPSAVVERYLGTLEDRIACVGCHGHRDGDLLPGRVTEELLGRGEPLLVIGPETDPVVPERVALCLDGSRWAESMAAEAARWSAMLDVPLIVVQALRSNGRRPGHDAVTEGYLHHVVEALAEGEIDVHAQLLHGPHPGPRLHNWLNEGPTLTIVATHGCSGWRHGVLGSVTSHLVRHLSGPAVVARPAGPAGRSGRIPPG